MNKISSNEITVVAQGPVDRRYTPDCLKSIRKVLPSSKIILSTWEGTNLEGLDYDEAVLSSDPGPYMARDLIPNNVNRQIVSTFEGLKKVKTRYSFKIRTDIQLLSDNWLLSWNKYPAKNSQWSLFEKKVIVQFIYYCLADGVDRPVSYAPFFISDWVYFGLTTDLLNLFDIPLMDHLTCGSDGYIPWYGNSCLWSPEQHIAKSWLSQKFDVSDYTNEAVTLNHLRLSDKIIPNNFIIVPNHKWKLTILKEDGVFNYKKLTQTTLYPQPHWGLSKKDYQFLYTKYSEGDK